MSTPVYVFATNKSWHLKVFRERVSKLPGNWLLIQHAPELTPEFVHTHRPRYIFFPHWSERVADEILHMTECVCFHETDLPYGRGGSPLQNLIVRGHKETQICALRMVEELDAGPIYCKQALSLAGSAKEIFARSALIVAEMIEKILSEQPEPIPQQGQVQVFKRRKPAQSEITSQLNSLEQIYDHIRMLDAEGYPQAFIDIGDFRLEFFDAELGDKELQARVQIKPRVISHD